MTQKHNSGAYDAPATTMDMDDFAAAVVGSIETALTHYAGSSDPSTGAPAAWGAAEVGYVWCDTTDPYTPVWKQWTKLTAGPTYGWRTLRRWKIRWLTTPAAVTFGTASPQAADVAWEDVDLTALLDASCQDAGQVLAAVRAVCLRIRVKTGASETIPTDGSDNCYFAVRENGSTTQFNVYPQVARRYTESQVWVGLDAGEIFEFMVDIGGGTAEFAYEAWVVGIAEEG